MPRAHRKGSLCGVWRHERLLSLFNVVMESLVHRKRLHGILASASLVVAMIPAPALASTKPPNARQRATAECKAELKRLGAHAFHQKYGVHNTNGAFRACVNKRLHAKKTG